VAVDGLLQHHGTSGTGRLGREQLGLRVVHRRLEEAVDVRQPADLLDRAHAGRSTPVGLGERGKGVGPCRGLRQELGHLAPHRSDHTGLRRSRVGRDPATRLRLPQQAELDQHLHGLVVLVTGAEPGIVLGQYPGSDHLTEERPRRPLQQCTASGPLLHVHATQHALK
jgi:hypothetical protein